MNQLPDLSAFELADDLGRYSNDPVGFVYWAFPWGEEESELRFKEGPESWQLEILTMLRDGIVDPQGAIMLAVTSGHGVGKSALVAWIVLWAMSTFPDTRGVVTANTENQLKTKTWVELAKWHRLFIARDMFHLTATALFSRDPDHQTTWRIDMVPWSERNTEAFAGMHNQGKRILVVFDEASAIPDLIHEVTEGALTDEDTEIIWCMFGNPTKNSGRFREAFAPGRFSHRWKSLKVDSRSISFTNKKQIAKWVDDYGEDSNFVRVRVKGEFPSDDGQSFIPYDLALAAAAREVPYKPNEPVVLGVDVARFGTDCSVIYRRQGLDAQTYPPELYFQIDTMELATKVAQAYRTYNARLVFVDAGGVGGGVVDRLNQLGIPNVAVDFGSKPKGVGESGVRYANFRADMWGAMREWLKFGCIVDDIPDIGQANGGLTPTLPDELIGPTYEINNQNKILLESKRDMERRGVSSPNVADALALTFAAPVVLTDERWKDDEKPTITPDYNPFTMENIYGLS
jgi:hypothetical protein